MTDKSSKECVPCRSIDHFLLLCMPRSGSTALKQMLNSNKNIFMGGEYLNEDLHELPANEEEILIYLTKKLKQESETDSLEGQKSLQASGFKVFASQLQNLRLDVLSKRLGIRHILVLWRRHTLDGIASLLIAKQTDNWWSHEVSESQTSYNIDPKSLLEEFESQKESWERVFDQWPLGIEPHFVAYEDLFSVDLSLRLADIVERLGVDSSKCFGPFSQRQNPGTLEEKVSNWQDFPEKLKNLHLNVPNLFTECLERSFGLRGDAYQLLPELEPPEPKKWIIRVGSPYLPIRSKENVKDAIDSGAVSSASHWVRSMSRELCSMFKVPVAVPTCNGFASLLLALQAADVGPGDDVIIPTFTMIAVANAVHFIQARPIFADSCQQNRYNPGWSEIDQVSTPNVKAVIVSHTYGVPCSDIEDLYSKCRERNWKLIEDISEVVGIKFITKSGEEKLLGSTGDFACASMYANKIVHAADGGFVLAKDPRLESKIQSLVNHGFTKNFHFVHFVKATNAKINGLGAALACGNLEHIEDIMGERQALAAIYRQKLVSIPQITQMPRAGSADTPWVFGIECSSKLIKTQLRKYLASYGIETRDYFFPIHLQPAFAGDELKVETSQRKRFKVAEGMCARGVYLPLHSGLTPEDVEFICDLISNFFLPQTSQKEIVNKLESKDFITDIVRVAEGDLPKIELKTFDLSTGQLVTSVRSNHPLLQTGTFVQDFESFFASNETWGKREQLLKECRRLKVGLKPHPKVLNAIADISQYLEIEQPELPYGGKCPWINVDLTSNRFAVSRTIPTLCQELPTKFFVWMIQEFKPQSVLEIGCWFGHSSVLMLEAGLEHIKEMYCTDIFKWYPWMNKFYKEQNGKTSYNMLDLFMKVTQSFRDVIKPLKWDVEYEETPNELQGKTFDFLLLDFTTRGDELERGWLKVRKHLIPQKTIVIIHGILKESCSFFTKYSSELELIANPDTRGKAFRYLGNSEELKIQPDMKYEQESQSVNNTGQFSSPRLNFKQSPGWNHHHLNAYDLVIETLKKEFHDESAKISFFPAVEQAFCEDEIPTNPWIGIIHNVENNSEEFYVPDLTKLCSRRISPWFKHCKGLFTLTYVQEEFLRKNLKLENMIPIQTIYYPIAELKVKPLSNKLLKDFETKPIQIVMIGSFQRDFNFFYRAKVPENIQKALLLGDEVIEQEAIKNAPKDICLIPRASSEEYENILQSSIIFLALKNDGMANTLVLEAISRNLPIVAPKMRSICQYIGDDYPLLYDPTSEDLTSIIQLNRLEAAVSYLQNKDKSHLSQDNFCRSIRESTVLASIPTCSAPPKYDLTISICSFRRTHHLPQILDSLWNRQTYEGSIQVIVWNNNADRKETVESICQNYVISSTKIKALELIQSTENYYCIVRQSIASLMKSECLIICDDDVIPDEGFLKFFMDNHQKHVKDVLCVRGHYFLEHKLPQSKPESTWRDYENLRFVGDEGDERLIHFAHADACLFPRAALLEVVSVPMPDDSFVLADDYWYSFVLSHKFGRKLRKLSTRGHKVLSRTDDSDQVGLALHTKPEVRSSRNRLYIHHMLQGWPDFKKENPKPPTISTLVKDTKLSAWNERFVGFNIHSEISDEELDVLIDTFGVNWVRIGAVTSSGRNEAFEFHFMEDDESAEFSQLIRKLSEKSLKIVLTLDPRIANVSNWQKIALVCATNPNVVGYDLINEPSTQSDGSSFWKEVTADGIKEVLDSYRELIKSIRQIDPVTPIIIEPTYWGQAFSLEVFDWSGFIHEFTDVMMSVHFYEPQKLTFRSKNGGKFEFPGIVPLYRVEFSSGEMWDQQKVEERIKFIKDWADKSKVKLFLGEMGISRNVRGADLYLKTLFKACKDNNFSAFIYAFRDPDWEAMDYEFGTTFNQNFVRSDQNNVLTDVIKVAIKSTKSDAHQHKANLQCCID